MRAITKDKSLIRSGTGDSAFEYARGMPTICFSVNADAAAGEVRQAYRRKCVVHHACL